MSASKQTNIATRFKERQNTLIRSSFDQRRGPSDLSIQRNKNAAYQVRVLQSKFNFATFGVGNGTIVGP